MKRGPLIAVVVAGAALLVLAGVVLWLVLRPSGPQSAAEDYLAALSRGDAASALGLVLTDGLDATSAEDAFAGVSETISEARVTAVDEDGDTATATIAYALDAASASGEITLVRTDAGWKVTQSGLGALTISSAQGDAAAIGTAIVEVGTPPLLLPGLYDVIPAPVGILTGTATAGVTPGGAATADLQPELSDTALETASAQVQAYIDACTAPTDAVPEGCGIRVPWAADLATLTSLAFRVETAPALAFAEDLSSFAATGGVLIATATGTARDGSAGTFTYRTDDWSLRGGMDFTGNQLVLSID